MTNHQPFPIDPAVEQLDVFALHFAPQVQYLDWASAELEYRRFLSLKKCYPNQMLMPSGAAWQLWQAHILDTRRYRSDCERLFNRFIDHHPYLGHDSAADRRERHFAEQLYKGLYARHYPVSAGALALSD